MIEESLLEVFFRDFQIDGLPQTWFRQEDSAALNEQTNASSTILEDFRAKLDLQQLKKEASTCSRCKLCETRKSVVFGEGNTNSPLIAFVGEGPGEEEDIQGAPFVGAAGKLLTNAIEKGLGLKREDLYICNVIKCRPPQNRTPDPGEILTCAPYLSRQLELINPKVIITLGATAQLALSKKEIGITKLRGQWQKWQGIPLMPTFHPAYILRNPPAKKPFWEDLQEVMKFLGLN